MHETSIVSNMVKTLESEYEKSKLDNLLEIHMKIGVLSNIEPTLLQNAYEAYISWNKQYQNVKLCIDLIPIKIYCDICKKESLVENYKFACSFCSTPTNHIIEGEELLIHKVIFKD